MEEKAFLERKGRQRARLPEMFLICISIFSHPWAGAAPAPAGLSPDSAQRDFSTCIFLISQDADSLGLHVVFKAAHLSAEPGPINPPFTRPEGPTRANVDVTCFFPVRSFLEQFCLLQLVSACFCVLGGGGWGMLVGPTELQGLWSSCLFLSHPAPGTTVHFSSRGSWTKGRD